MQIHRDIQLLQPVFEQERAFLAGKLCDRHASHIEPLLPVGVDQAEHVCVISDTKISADLILLDIFRADHDHDLRLGAQLF